MTIANANSGFRFVAQPSYICTSKCFDFQLLVSLFQCHSTSRFCLWVSLLSFFWSLSLCLLLYVFSVKEPEWGAKAIQIINQHFKIFFKFIASFIGRHPAQYLTWYFRQCWFFRNPLWEVQLVCWRYSFLTWNCLHCCISGPTQDASWYCLLVLKKITLIGLFTLFFNSKMLFCCYQLWKNFACSPVLKWKLLL